MWEFTQRRARFEQALEELVSELNSKDVRIIQTNDKDFIRLVRKYRKKRKDPNCRLDITTNPYLESYTFVGYTSNPNYEGKMEVYKDEMDKWKKEKQEIEQRWNKFLQTPEAKIYHHVVSEEEKKSKKCPSCGGSGLEVHGGYQEGLTESYCTGCDGEGSVADVTNEQWQIYLKVKKRMENPEEVRPMPFMPPREIKVFARISCLRS